MSTDDRLDEGFELLRTCPREQAPFDLDLEERMMKEFANTNRNWMPRFGKLAAAALLCITVAGAAVAATGGVGWVLERLNLTGTIEFPNGDTYDLEDGKIVDVEGNVIGTIELTGEAVEPDGEAATMEAVTIYPDSEAGADDIEVRND